MQSHLLAWVLSDDKCVIYRVKHHALIYMVMKNFQKMMVSLQQKHRVITFDLAIYSKAKEIQWRLPE